MERLKNRKFRINFVVKESLRRKLGIGSTPGKGQLMETL